MGDYYQIIVDKDASSEEAKSLSSDILNWLVEQGIVEATINDCVISGTGLGYPPGEHYQGVVEYDDFDIQTLRTNGLNIVVEHMVFMPTQGKLYSVCPQCSTMIACNDEWFKAVDEWYEGNGQSIVRCSNCGYANSIADWSAAPPWGFGNLGFVFWNWSRLKQFFIDDFARRLRHRTIYMAGKF